MDNKYKSFYLTDLTQMIDAGSLQEIQTIIAWLETQKEDVGNYVTAIEKINGILQLRDHLLHSFEGESDGDR